MALLLPVVTSLLTFAALKERVNTASLYLPGSLVSGRVCESVLLSHLHNNTNKNSITILQRQLGTMACKRGALIVLEGVDKAGKTTQCNKLVQALQQSGRPAEMMRFPERTTKIGQLINAYLENKSNLEDHTVHLLFSANRWELVPLIKEKLDQGTTLVIDRYAFSGVAFTSAKPGFSLDWCMQPDVGLPKPDLVMFLKLNPTEAALRGQFGTERYETSVFQRAVQQRFELLMKDSSVNWQIIDASQSIDDVHANIKNHSVNAMDTANEQPLGELWKGTSLDFIV